jgi:CHAD domain-containing protein
MTETANEVLLKELKKYLHSFITQQRQSIEDVHELRVRSRELYSLLSAKEPFRKTVKKVIKISNKVRDIDVFVEVYFASLPKKYRIALDAAHVLKATAKSRKKEIKKLHDYLKTFLVPKSAVFDDTNHKKEYILNTEEVKLDKEALHKYRIYIKELLYKEKNSTTPSLQNIQILTKIKDILGTINDNFNGIQRISDFDMKAKLLQRIKEYTQEENLKLFKKFKKFNQKYTRSIS